MRQNPFVPALAALLLAAASPVPAQQGPDDLWETTMTMQAEGMKMPPMTQQVCSPKGKPESRMEMDPDSKCKMVESKQTGNKFTFKMACTQGADSYTGLGEMEDLSKDAYRGFFSSSGVRDGRNFNMRMDMSGKRVGSCDAAAIERKAKAQEAAIEKQQRDYVTKACNDALAKLDPFAAFGYEAGAATPAVCPERQGEFCAAAGKVFKSAGSREGWTAAVSKYRSDTLSIAAKACKVDLAAVRAPLCKEAVAKKDWNWLRDNDCPEAVALRKQHCAGRTYSSVDPRYSDLCAALGGLSYTADEVTQDGSSSGGAGGVSGASVPVDPKTGAPSAGQGVTVPPPEAPKKPSTTEKLKEGAEKLRKFLKF
jgi:hypothetical protein